MCCAEVVTEDQIPKSNKEAFRKLDKIKEKERDTIEKQARKKVIAILRLWKSGCL